MADDMYRGISTIIEKLNNNDYSTYQELINDLSILNSDILNTSANILYNPMDVSYAAANRSDKERGSPQKSYKRDSIFGVVLGKGKKTDVYVDVPPFNKKIIKDLTTFDKVLKDEELLKEYDDLIFEDRIGGFFSTFISWTLSPGKIVRVNIPDNYPNHRTKNKSDAYIIEAYSHTIISEKGDKTPAEKASLSATNSSIGITRSPTTEGSWANLNDNEGLVVNGKQIGKVQGVNVKINGEYHFPRRNTRNKVIQLVIHETAGTSKQGAINEMKSQNLSVQLILNPDGVFTQHGDIVQDVLQHANFTNPTSFGVEIVNPYYPNFRVTKENKKTWPDVIDAAWADKKKYTVASKAQLEAITSLIRWAISYKKDGVSIDSNWLNYDTTKKEFYFKKVSAEFLANKSGVFSHLIINASDHSDGTFPTFYAFLRIVAGLAPEAAYTTAINLAGKTKNGVVSVADIGAIKKVS